DIRVLHMESPSPYTEFGIKGLGEGGAVGPPAAIISAVNDALRPLGVEVHNLPLTPASVLDAIAQGRGGAKAAQPCSRHRSNYCGQRRSSRRHASSPKVMAARGWSLAVNLSALC